MDLQTKAAEVLNDMETLDSTFTATLEDVIEHDEATVILKMGGYVSKKHEALLKTKMGEGLKRKVFIIMILSDG